MNTIGQDEAAQAMAERDPIGEREHVLRFLCGKAARLEVKARNEDAACAMVNVASAVTPLWRAEANGLMSVANAIERGEHVSPPERTPETVLRAMVNAYAQAAVDAEVAVFRCATGTVSAAIRYRMINTQDAAANMRAAAAIFIAEGAIVPWLTLRTDYQQRLSGARDLNAPPLEDP